MSETPALFEKVDDLEKVPGPYRGLYSEAEDGFTLDAAPKAKVDEFRENNIKLMKELEELKGIKPEFERLREEAAKREEEALAATKDADQVREAMSRKLNEVQERAKSEATTLRSQLDELLLDSEARKALDAHAMHTELALPHVKSRVQMKDREGQRVAVVVNPDGSPAVNDDGSFKGVAQLVEEMASSDTYAALKRSTAATGGGATTPGVGGSTVRSKKDLGSVKAKVAYIEKHGRKAFEALPLTHD